MFILQFQSMKKKYPTISIYEKMLVLEFFFLLFFWVYETVGNCGISIFSYMEIVG